MQRDGTGSQRRLRTCRVTPVETRFRHSVHAYHGVQPWSRDGTHLLYFGFETLDEGHLVVQELRTGRETILGTTPIGDFHTAAKQRWVFDDTAVLFASPGAEGVTCPTLVFLERPGELQPLRRLAGRSIRSVCADGQHVLGAGEVAGEGPAAVELIDLRTEEIQTLVTAADAVAVLPEELRVPGASYHFNHPVFNPAETRLFFKLMQHTPEKGTAYCAFFVMDRNDRRPRCFGNRISGHPHWMPDNRHILNVKSPRDGSDNRWLVLVDSDTGEDHRVLDLPIEGPGHPSPSPDGDWIATDAFTRDGEQSPIYVLDPRAGTAREIIRLRHRFRGGRPYLPREVTRGQPHPVWSPDSRQLLVNCNEGGERMHLLLLHDFLPPD